MASSVEKAARERREPFTLQDALQAAFGSSTAPRSTLAGAFLCGIPFAQKTCIVAGCTVKMAMRLSNFLQLFTHGSYVKGKVDESTIAYTWDLVDERKWMLASAGSMYFMGTAVGCVAGGFLMDAYGRRPIIIWGTLANALCLFLCAVSANVGMYCVFRFISGALGIALMEGVYVMSIEWVPGGWRAPLSGFLFGSTAMGEVLVAVLAAAMHAAGFTTWRQLNIAASIVCLTPLLFQGYMLESPCWLHESGRTEETVAMLCKVAKQNGAKEVAKALKREGLRPAAAEESVSSAISSEGAKWCSGPLLSAMLRLSTVVMALMWFTSAGVFYGISLGAKALSQCMSLYVTAMISALSEFPAGVAQSWMFGVFGRRLSTTLLFTIGALFCFGLTFLCEAESIWVSVLALLGKFFITAVFDGIYVFTSEVFETEIRGSALGLCSAAGRLGSILAPQANVFLDVRQSYILFGSLSLFSGIACQLVMREPVIASEDAVATIGEANAARSVSRPSGRVSAIIDRALEEHGALEKALLGSSRVRSADAPSRQCVEEARGRPSSGRRSVEMSRLGSVAADAAEANGAPRPRATEADGLRKTLLAGAVTTEPEATAASLAPCHRSSAVSAAPGGPLRASCVGSLAGCGAGVRQQRSCSVSTTDVRRSSCGPSGSGPSVALLKSDASTRDVISVPSRNLTDGELSSSKAGQDI